MRPLPRPVRRFRPVPSPLEALTPVSSLVPGLSLAAGALVAAAQPVWANKGPGDSGCEFSGLHRPVPDPTTVAQTPSRVGFTTTPGEAPVERSGAFAQTTARLGGDLTAPALAPATFVDAPDRLPSAPQVAAATAPFPGSIAAQPLTTPTPSVSVSNAMVTAGDDGIGPMSLTPPVAPTLQPPAFAPVGGDVGQGASAVAAFAPATLTAALAHVSAPSAASQATPTAAAIDSPSTPATPSSNSAPMLGDDGIRPMTLTPTAATGRQASVATDDFESPPSGGSSESGTGYASGFSGGSGHAPIYKVRMIGPGKKTYYPSDPVPDVIQGSIYSSGGASLWDVGTNPPTRLDDGINDWQLRSYQWTFPGGAVKGYGRFNQAYERAGEPSSVYYTFAGDPGQTTYARLDPFTADDLEKAPPVESNDHVIDTFYWGPAATGTQTVSINATFVNTRTQQQITDSDSVTFNVARPTGSIDVLSFGTAGVSGGGTRLEFDYRYPAYVGIERESYVNPTAGPIVSIGGEFSVLQTMTYLESRRYTGWPYGIIYTEEKGILPDRTRPGVILDLLHYNSTGAPISVGADPSGQPISDTDSDSPFSPLVTPGYPYSSTTPLDHSRNDSFTTTLMYKPSGGIWIPVGRITWDWGGVATWNGTTYTQSVAYQHLSSNYVTTTEFPTWNYSFAGVSTTWIQTSP